MAGVLRCDREPEQPSERMRRQKAVQVSEVQWAWVPGQVLTHEPELVPVREPEQGLG